MATLQAQQPQTVDKPARSFYLVSGTALPWNLMGVAVILQFGHALFLTPMLDVLGASAIVLPVLIVVVAGFLVWYARSAKAKGWIR